MFAKRLHRSASTLVAALLLAVAAYGAASGAIEANDLSGNTHGIYAWTGTGQGNA